MGSDLTAGAKATKRLAFEEFYVARFAWAVRLAYGLTGDASSAEEIVQDVFSRVAGRYDSVEHPVSYVRAGVVNAVRSRRRRALLERRQVWSLPDPTTPSSLVEFADVLNALPLRQRTAVVLRYLEDLDDDAIAALLRCRPATVRSLLHRGLAALREVLGDG